MSKKASPQKPSTPKAKDLKPNKDAKGGLLLPAIQKVRGAATGGG